jgi:hypothetical protein
MLEFFVIPLYVIIFLSTFMWLTIEFQHKAKYGNRHTLDAKFYPLVVFCGSSFWFIFLPFVWYKSLVDAEWYAGL